MLMTSPGQYMEGVMKSKTFDDGGKKVFATLAALLRFIIAMTILLTAVMLLVDRTEAGNFAAVWAF
jgi:hypothetical protein